MLTSATWLNVGPQKEICNFMALYKEEEALWNTFNPSYKNRDLRKVALERIAKEMELENLTDVTKKIKNLRSTYNQENFKISKSKESDSGTDAEYKPSIKWFHLMDSIMKIINLKEKTTSNLPNTTNETEGVVPENDIEISKPKKSWLKTNMHTDEDAISEHDIEISKPKNLW
ncbi:hypothetical protein FQR65_LT17391 [Abscondita terminalis]|nr:hypothetical protein FQR65_LT17391 [Abscondita terminalis]